MGKHTEDKCCKCGSLEIRPRKSSKYAKICNPCNRAAKESWAIKNPRHGADYMRKKSYGVTPEQYDELFIAQKGKCAICETSQTNLKGALHLDHGHETGVIRGLLCLHCNTGLGHFKDNCELLAQAINYLTTRKT